ncbi:2-oxoglutarate-Fe(II)-dependent oxygenase superfamily protein [Roseivirga ehrenbergii]|uniref:Proline hydroxylase n=1 Tax=Roseivirga ehrenbergii (strain DSM 102268 / JCM 13514 / KCTC 12282 / NCIMB 14502 / KMM 6017) TaxID=279360 RepID=A0A150XN35_ROSEK|nr:2OG-Fe(II) oxygenase [Roseivirga ehrenbergii]KYG80158.1 proline hydroxylase [Roseivirga ehrenbergii]TCK99188.1 2-oxoglutarate-Fe(II)-dependent oxygenase superfamily protein [Roseivirga ehrenbergii]
MKNLNEVEIQKADIKGFDINRLTKKLGADSSVFRRNTPFPYIVLDSFLNGEIANEALSQFPKVGKQEWISYLHYNEKKFGLNKYEQLPSTIKKLIDELNSPSFLEYLTSLSGIENLIADPSLEGGGLHLSERGGFLNIHADFTVHPHRKTWERRLNLLIYLNTDWEESYNGKLELWDNKMTECKASLAPTFNRAVIFATNSDSYHGFPDPIQCPEGMTRKSIALYYYTAANKEISVRSTNYKARPGDGIKKVFIYGDKQLINLYTLIKRTFGLNDDFASKILRLINRKRK